MKITIIAVGRIKERFYRDAVAEYVKRLGRYCRPEIIEVEDEPTPDKAGQAAVEAVLQKEAGRILRHLDGDGYTVALDIRGREFDSEAFAGQIESLGTGGVSHIRFVIGGSLGLGQEVYKKADLTVSFSHMTFPHQLMRVILLEQIYRAYRIINGEPYHK